MSINPPPLVIVAIHFVIVAAIIVHVIFTRPKTGVAFAWLFLVSLVPIGGAIAYLMIGERRIGRTRRRRLENLRAKHQEVLRFFAPESLAQINWSELPASARQLDAVGNSLVGGRTFSGSSLELMSDTLSVLQKIAHDVDNAKTSVLMEFFIWNSGGQADNVFEALMRAAKRGVSCRILVDGVGSRAWLKGKQPGKLRAAGVEVTTALPVGLFRTVVGRTDLRLHRKIVVVDGTVAWTGSMNMVDPRYFKQNVGVGEWVDAMVRISGEAVIPLTATMIGDWTLETGGDAEKLFEQTGLRNIKPDGDAALQVIPSGPGESGDALLEMLISLTTTAERELILTTPYLVPDDALLAAFRVAASRGVSVKMIVPKVVDTFVTRHASRSYYDELLDRGVEIYLFEDGLLHTKSIVVDECLSMFGTANMDMRSLWLNYELSLFVHDAAFAKNLKALQLQYMEKSQRVDPMQWRKRPLPRTFLEDAMRLASSLL